MAVTINETENIKDFVDTAYLINKNNKFWVGELKKSALELLSLAHPFWKNAERKLFVCYKDGKPAGRIAAIINRAHNDYHKETSGFFGFFESVKDKKVSEKLFEAAQEWLKEKGMTKVIGPMNPSTNYSCGMLTAGFESFPQVMMPYNPPYYNEHLEYFGYTKAKDLYAFIRFSDTQISQRIEKIVNRVERNIKINLRNIKVSNLNEELEVVREIYNQAWADNWGFIPITKEEMACTAKDIKPILNPKVTYVIEVDNTPVAFAIAIPNVNNALKKIKGTLNVFNLLPFIYTLKKTKQGRLILLGVKEEYRNKGLELVMIKQLVLDCRKLGWSHGEISWILEDNEKIISIIKEFGGRLYKKYRIYEKDL